MNKDMRRAQSLEPPLYSYSDFKKEYSIGKRIVLEYPCGLLAMWNSSAHGQARLGVGLIDSRVHYPSQL